MEFVSKYKIGPIFTPPVVSKWEGPRATLILPAATGGANWQGGSFDPETHIMYVFSVTPASALGLVPPDERRKSDMNFITGPRRPIRASAARGRGRRSGAGGESGNGLFVQGLPLIKPPYGRITAIDLNKGEIVWQIAHGETPDNIRNHPALKGLTIPRTGRDGRIGTLVTKTLVIAGEGGFFTLPDGRARRDAARVRQGDRQGRRRGVHARAADRIADDLHAERQAVHRGRHRRRQLQRRTRRVRAARRRAETLTTDGEFRSSKVQS